MLGPRKLPVLGNTHNGKLLMDNNTKLQVEVEKSSIYFQDNGKKYDIGSQIVYFVE